MENTLKHLRQQAGLKQEFVAFKLGVSQQIVSKWEAGKCKPNREHLSKLAKLYGCENAGVQPSDHFLDVAKMIKFEAIKEFWGELKSRNTLDERIVNVETGDKLLKEMVGE